MVITIHCNDVDPAIPLKYYTLVSIVPKQESLTPLCFFTIMATYCINSTDPDRRQNIPDRVQSRNGPKLYVSIIDQASSDNEENLIDVHTFCSKASDYFTKPYGAGRTNF